MEAGILVDWQLVVGDHRQKILVDQLIIVWHFNRHVPRGLGPKGEILSLSRLRALVELTPVFGEKADLRLTKKISLEYSMHFWLDKYFDKELLSVVLCENLCCATILIDICGKNQSLLMHAFCCTSREEIIHSSKAPPGRRSWKKSFRHLRKLIRRCLSFRISDLQNKV